MASSSGEDHGLLLGLTLSTTTHHITTAKPPNNNNNNSGVQTFEPSLSLALITPTDPVNNGADDIDQQQQYRGVSCTRGQEASPPNSAVSSFSAASGGGGRIVMKRERDVVSSTDEMETAERVRASDEEEDGGSTAAAARKKLRLTKEQSALLEESFKHHSTLNPKQKQGLARQLNLRARQVEVWFQNRRARTKLKQTEVDCELLKKCCETLTDENRRLHKELQELKGLKSSPQQPPQFYMQMPAASTLSMCPSCERIAAGSVASTTSTTVAAGGADHLRGGPNSSAFSMAQKPQFLNPFTNPSAAC